MNDERLPDGMDDPRDLAAGHALGILTPEEQERYERFLSEHPEARGEADAFAEVAEALVADAPAVEPSPGFKADLMALIATTPQLPLEEPDEDHEAPAAPRLVPVASEGERSGPTARRDGGGSAANRARSRWFARPAVYLSAAAAAAVIVVGGVTLPPLLSSGPGQTQQQTALEQIRSAPDAQETTGTVATGEQATLVWSSSLGRSALVVDDLAPLPEDKTYELWYIGSSGPVAAGTFDGGEGSTVAPLEGSLTEGGVVAVTVEDAGGSPTPTTDPILAIDIA
ncbi:anti-sigma factor domain-containing protein [Rathayibacter sp. AY1C6]|uniref:anti-sigma factor n=1 Tax=Rathayibacter sp. AY1C6 TaxID=2080539 RepID=UPI0011B05A2E|nr:anti-sigma factor [Rathayibacter sp. AY1C6]